MGLASMAVLGVGVLMVTLSLNLIAGWSLDASCPGETEFCNGIWWNTVVEYLPAWLYVGQILVVIALASPWAIIRVHGT